MKPLITSILFLLILTGCQNTKTKTTKRGEDKSHTLYTEKHWSYNGETGPTHWKEVEANSQCGGKYQSPINIVNYKIDETLTPLNITYSANTHIHDVINNGHTIQYNFDVGDFIISNRRKYELKQFHFHEPAEHLIDGIRYPMVLHLVHVSSAGKYAVLAVMAKEGASSKPFDFLESYLPVPINETKKVDMAFDMNLNLPENKAYFNYTGSLTTPPCTESVEWFIFKHPITVSLKQVEELRNLMPLNNYRDEQPHNGRQIRMSK